MAAAVNVTGWLGAVWDEYNKPALNCVVLTTKPAAVSTSSSASGSSSDNNSASASAGASVGREKEVWVCIWTSLMVCSYRRLGQGLVADVEAWDGGGGAINTDMLQW